MATSDDPLDLLRQSITAQSHIHLLDSSTQPPTQVYSLPTCSHLSFPTSQGKRISLAKNIETRYKGPQGFYDLQTLLRCYLTREKAAGQYIQEAQAEGCGFVSITERKHVADYLESKISESQSVVPRPSQRSTTPTNVPTTTTLAGTTTATIASGIGAGGANTPSNVTGSGTGTNGRLASSLQDNSNVPPLKRARYVVNKEAVEEFKRIQALQDPIQVADRRTVLRGDKNVNFDMVKSLISERMKLGREEQERLRRGGGGGHIKSAPPPVIGLSGKPRRKMEPIIIVSPSSSALITLCNVKRFLEDAVFESSSGRGPAEGLVHVYHRRGTLTSSTSSSASTLHLAQPSAVAAATVAAAQGQDRPARYTIVDSVETLSRLGGDDPWERVVCVLTTGQEWQFRPYKWSDPKELFHHVKGFFVQYAHDPPNAKVRAWNVTELRLDQSKRHIDKSAAADFWRSLEAWIALNKPFIAY